MLSRVVLIAHTPSPDKLVANAAVLCYSKRFVERMSPKRQSLLISRLLNDKHLSPFEHASFTFLIENISRNCLCQLTRHRMASYTVCSQRYVHSDEYVLSIPSISDEDLRAIKQSIDRSFAEYSSLLLKNLKKEDARSVLPGACSTKLVMTINARSLMNFFNLRCCQRAQHEIRCLANKMLNTVRAVAPQIFHMKYPDCQQCYNKCKAFYLKK